VSSTCSAPRVTTRLLWQKRTRRRDPVAERRGEAVIAQLCLLHRFRTSRAVSPLRLPPVPALWRCQRTTTAATSHVQRDLIVLSNKFTLRKHRGRKGGCGARDEPQGRDGALPLRSPTGSARCCSTRSPRQTAWLSASMRRAATPRLSAWPYRASCLWPAASGCTRRTFSDRCRTATHTTDIATSAFAEAGHGAVPAHQ
jgi:hypothetical protein